jgi:dTDP-4-dehydrorhamnose reductase
MKKILMSGGDGKFAAQIIKHNTEYQILAPSKKEMDITNMKAVEQHVLSFKPDIFLHAAAYTRPMAKHHDNPDKSIQINIIGTANIVLSCMRHDVKLVYISTDYVYPGTEGDYQETNPLLPYSKNGYKDGCFKYGWSKLGGEAAVHVYDNSLILRICMCNFPFPHNKALADVKKNLIYDKEAAKITLQILDETGVINIGGESRTIYEFAKENNPNMEKIFVKDIEDVNMAPDITMNVNKLKGILKNR